MMRLKEFSVAIASIMVRGRSELATRENIGVCSQSQEVMLIGVDFGVNYS
ncbi:MAG: hypothetical protein KFF72_04480 [Arthrospira sp. SH-MAG29]|nr:hypothetical protein [Arthrospira sp. SH-MAG29]MBS0015615.1 hypothetical protein [Arthrospira sp. SH-MAG29]